MRMAICTLYAQLTPSPPRVTFSKCNGRRARSSSSQSEQGQSVTPPNRLVRAPLWSQSSRAVSALAVQIHGAGAPAPATRLGCVAASLISLSPRRARDRRLGACASHRFGWPGWTSRHWIRLTSMIRLDRTAIGLRSWSLSSAVSTLWCRRREAAHSCQDRALHNYGPDGRTARSERSVYCR